MTFDGEKSANYGDTPGFKLDAGKLRYDLIPPEMSLGLALVLSIGAYKYEDRNWEQGMSWMRVYASLMRHLQAWVAGEDIDSETGLYHIDQVMTNAGFLATYARRYDTRKLDDRIRLLTTSSAMKNDLPVLLARIQRKLEEERSVQETEDNA
jgi:hypothetical protein